jgi:hypothetical protein
MGSATRSSPCGRPSRRRGRRLDARPSGHAGGDAGAARATEPGQDPGAGKAQEGGGHRVPPLLLHRERGRAERGVSHGPGASPRSIPGPPDPPPRLTLHRHARQDVTGSSRHGRSLLPDSGIRSTVSTAGHQCPRRLTKLASACALLSSMVVRRSCSSDRSILAYLGLWPHAISGGCHLDPERLRPGPGHHLRPVVAGARLHHATVPAVGLHAAGLGGR